MTPDHNMSHFKVTTMSKKQLAAAYGISENTLRKWLRKVIRKNKILFTKTDNDKLLNPKQVQAFVNHHGEP